MQVRKRARKTTGGARRAVLRVARSRWAWLAASAVLVVQLFGFGHFALIAHTRCVHGELVHVEAVRDDHAQAHADHADPGDAHALTAPRDGQGDGRGDGVAQGEAPDGHAHCEATGLVPALVAVAPSCAPLTLLEVFVLSEPAASSDGVYAIATLSLAPKSSPPV